jgi:hypothetical protein
VKLQLRTKDVIKNWLDRPVTNLKYCLNLRLYTAVMFQVEVFWVVTLCFVVLW